MSSPENEHGTTDLVAAFAQYADLRLSAEERTRLEEYVETVWDMAARLRDVETPGLEGLREDLPLRAAEANRPRGGDDAGVAGPGAGASGAAGSGARSAAAAAAPNGVRAVEEEVLAGGALRISAAIARGELTPLDVVHALLERIDRYDGAVRSYITVDRAGAAAHAAELTAELERGAPRSLLHGIPYGVKDNIPAAGIPNTFNSPLTRDWVPRRDAEAVRRLRAAGAVLIGKHNLNEFGWSLPTEDDLAPPPRNPFMPEERSVGSSSGGGAAVAAGLAVFALGTDGGGSTRLPAGQHNLFGVKPGHDDVARGGVGEGSVSEVGVLARTAPDAAAVLAALHVDPDAPDAGDRLRSGPRRQVAFVQEPPAALRVGIPAAYVADVGMEDDVGRAFAEARRACEELGWHVVDLPRRALDVLHDAVRANFVVIAAEHYFDHEGPGKRRERYGESAGFYNLPGACLSAADYLHALRVGRIARAAVDTTLGDVDLLLMPTSPVTRTSTARDPKTHRRGGNAAYTAPFNITGHPSISFPIGVSGEGLPIGAQLVGRLASEFEQLRAGHAVAARLRLPRFPDMDEVEERVHGVSRA